MDTEDSERALLLGHENVEDTSYEKTIAAKKGNKWGGSPATHMLNDYDKLMIHLFSQHHDVNAKLAEDFKSSADKNTVELPDSLLMKVKEIWEGVLPHRELHITGTRITVSSKDVGAKEYSPTDMSDGERVVFYLVGQCLSAKPSSVIVIDEPEMHLHKAIQYILWDKLEKVRSDCVFVYLTHDVEFAASRVGFKKIWLKGYDGENWEWKEVLELEDLPEDLVLEVCGSRKKVLFVEGCHSSYDVQLYKNIFDKFLVKPCGSCEEVVKYVKAFRKVKEFHQVEVLGLIDRDRRAQAEISNLSKDCVYCLKVAEVEHLFLVPEMLQLIADLVNSNAEEAVKKVKEIIFEELKSEIDVQVAETANKEIKHKINTADLRGDNSTDAESKILSLNKLVDAAGIFKAVKEEYDRIIRDNDYESLLATYNNKNIAERAGETLGLSDESLPAFVIKLSQSEQHCSNTIELLEKYIPEDLINANK